MKAIRGSQKALLGTHYVLVLQEQGEDCCSILDTNLPGPENIKDEYSRRKNITDFCRGSRLKVQVANLVLRWGNKIDYY
jgi:hypothetical protein